MVGPLPHKIEPVQPLAVIVLDCPVQIVKLAGAIVGGNTFTTVTGKAVLDAEQPDKVQVAT